MEFQPLARSMPLVLGLLLALLPLLEGCATQPQHVTKHKRGKKCDCPKWNHIPRQMAPSWSEHADLGAKEPVK
ncbi:MAG: hypothetical protein IPK99_08890 [Flavobacteriales bacterium]|nr:hypothetical protein [Flavobacteriales bacterium]